MINKAVFYFCLLLATNVPMALAQEAERPKIGLVLSGGGAKGAAHIGVLETLEKTIFL